MLQKSQFAEMLMQWLQYFLDSFQILPPKYQLLGQLSNFQTSEVPLSLSSYLYCSSGCNNASFYHMCWGKPYENFGDFKILEGLHFSYVLLLHLCCFLFHLTSGSFPLVFVCLFVLLCFNTCCYKHEMKLLLLQFSQSNLQRQYFSASIVDIWRKQLEVTA